MELRVRRDGGDAWWARPRPATPAWVALSIVTGLLLGAAVALAPAGLAWIAGAMAAVVVAAAALRWPPLVPAAFWVAFSLQQTLFYGFSVTGLYYPVYLLLAANLVLALLLGRLRLDVGRLWPYLLFLIAVLVSLLRLPQPLDFDGYQRLFAYAMGLLVYVQLAGRRGAAAMMGAQLAAALAIAGWVVVSSIETGFTYRGGVAVDQNDVSFLLGFGLIVLLALLMGAGLRPRERIAAWIALAVGAYALLLLASRGVSLAFFAAAVVMYARILLDARRSVPILVLAIVAALLLLTLPGSDALLERFSGSDVSTANDRLPLWRGAIDAYATGDLYQSLLGRGFESSEGVARSVSATVSSTHNAYLQLLVELGLFGLVAFVAIHVTLFVRFWRSRSPLALYGAGVVLFMALADLSLNIPDNFVYWVAIGFVLALDSAGAREPDAPVRAARATGRATPSAVPIPTPDPPSAQ